MRPDNHIIAKKDAIPQICPSPHETSLSHDERPLQDSLLLDNRVFMDGNVIADMKRAAQPADNSPDDVLNLIRRLPGVPVACRNGFTIVLNIITYPHTPFPPHP